MLDDVMVDLMNNWLMADNLMVDVRLVNGRMVDGLDRNVSNPGPGMMCVLGNLDVASGVTCGVMWLAVRILGVVRLLKVVVRAGLVWRNFWLHVVVGMILRRSTRLSHNDSRNSESKSLHQIN